MDLKGQRIAEIIYQLLFWIVGVSGGSLELVVRADGL
jgi:hypothetical protein